MTYASTLRRKRGSPVLECLFASAVFAGASGAAFGQAADNVTIDARRCMQIESADERLACFESQVSTAPAAAPAPSAPAAPASSAVPPRSVDVGAAPAQAAPAAAASTAAESAVVSVGNITSVQAREPNRYLITLDNGEVWEQRVAERSPRPLVGQGVRIERTHWGSHQRLYIEGLNGFLQVQRVR